MKEKLKLAFEQLEKEMEIISKQDQKSVIGGDGYYYPPQGDCLAEALSYIYNGTIAAADVYRNMLINSGTCVAVPYSGQAAYIEITNPSGFVDFLGTAVSGYCIMGNLSTNGIGYGNTQTLAKAFLGGSVNGIPVAHAIIITGQNSDGSYQYYDPTNNVSGNVSSGSIQASLNIACIQP